MKTFIYLIFVLGLLNIAFGMISFVVGAVAHDWILIISGISFVLFGHYVCPWMIKLLAEDPK